MTLSLFKDRLWGVDCSANTPKQTLNTAPSGTRTLALEYHRRTHKTERCKAALFLFLLLISAVESPDDVMLKHALAPITGRSVDGIFDYLDRIRPAPVKDSDRPYLLKDMTLVTDTMAIKDPVLRQRLKQRVRNTLALHRRIKVVEFFIFHYPYPVAMNKPGAFIAVSDTLLQMIGDDDAALVGIISHELGHEYVADEMFTAKMNRDLGKQRELELFCDAVAVASLVALGLDPAHYAAILERIVNSSKEAAKLNNGEREMPNIALRKRLIADLSSHLCG